MMMTDDYNKSYDESYMTAGTWSTMAGGGEKTSWVRENLPSSPGSGPVTVFVFVFVFLLSCVFVF